MRRGRRMRPSVPDWRGLVQATSSQVRFDQEAKVTRMGRVKKCLSHFFCAPLGDPFRPFVRSLVAFSHWFPIGTGPGSAQNGSVAYQVAKVEMSNFSALGLPPGAKSQNHRVEFLKTLSTRNLTGYTREKRSMHEVRRHPPCATASTYTSQQSRVSILRP